MGDTGTGKTYSIRTLLEANITPFIIFTEPGMETLGDVLDQCHWRYIPAKTAGWSEMAEMFKKVNTLNFDLLSKTVDTNKKEYTGFLDVIAQCNNFIDQEGEEFGDVAEFGTDRVLVIDSLSALNDMAMQLVVGGKVTRQLQDWMVAQNTLEMLINKLVSDLRCWFLLTAHLEREKNEITGGLEVMVSTLGRKLAPRLPKYFSDVIEAKREGKDFFWSTDGMGVATKARNVPIEKKLQPTFTSLVSAWKERGGIINP
jgi:hypothetical protein